MIARKSVFLLSVLFVLFSVSSHAQVITSKKEAIKKGVYKKPSQKVAPEVQAAVVKVTEEKPSKKPATKPVAKPATKVVASKTAKSKKSLIRQTEDTDLVPDTSGDSYLALQMINNAMTFIGTRYLGGGTTIKGMDCSGMVTAVFDIFDLKLPRSSAEMAKVGVKVAKEDIKKGDLIFFHTNGKRIINHVGMVIEVLGDEIKFVHSSTQKGVIVSSTKEPYYQRAFAQANRVL